jgi:hypothetical protein
MSLWYSTLSMGSFIDGDGNIIRWKHIEELQNIQEQEGWTWQTNCPQITYNFSYSVADAIELHAYFINLVKALTCLQLYNATLNLWSMSVYTFNLNEKNVSFSRFTDRIHVWKVMIRTVLNENLSVNFTSGHACLEVKSGFMQVWACSVR